MANQLVGKVVAMKRFDIDLDPKCPFTLKIVEDSGGEWVRFEDAEQAIAQVRQVAVRLWVEWEMMGYDKPPRELADVFGMTAREKLLALRLAGVPEDQMSQNLLKEASEEES